MEFLHESVEAEYRRCIHAFMGEDPYESANTVGLHEVLRAHFLIVDFFLEAEYGIGGVGPKSNDLLHSAIYRQFVGFEGKEKWPDVYEKLATLVYGLVKDHPFHDGNKRTALLVMLYQLKKWNRFFTIPQKEIEDFVVEIAENKLKKYARYVALTKQTDDPEIQFIADYLKRNTRQVDKTNITVTFHQLNQILKKYGYELVNPSRNFIDVVQVDTKPKYLGLIGPKTRRESKLTQVGFPGWKKQVGKGTLKKVRDETGLIPEKGYDSKTFFHGADSMHTLIAEYAEPLKRLADR